jgi:hypothetical protein
MPIAGALFVGTAMFMGMTLAMHTLFAARIHPREWVRKWIAILRFFLPGKKNA